MRTGMGDGHGPLREARRQVVERIVELEREVLRAIRAATAPAWLQLEVTMAQLKALVLLADHQPLTIRSLAQGLGIGSPAASHLVERLVQMGLVERQEDPDDRRRTFATLTADGGEAIGRLRQEGLEHLREWVGQVKYGVYS
jgi:DNA-binding MarR family transcriptional regulator